MIINFQINIVYKVNIFKWKASFINEMVFCFDVKKFCSSFNFCMKTSIELPVCDVANNIVLSIHYNLASYTYLSRKLVALYIYYCTDDIIISEVVYNIWRPATSLLPSFFLCSKTGKLNVFWSFWLYS